MEIGTTIIHRRDGSEQHMEATEIIDGGWVRGTLQDYDGQVYLSPFEVSRILPYNR